MPAEAGRACGALVCAVVVVVVAWSAYGPPTPSAMPNQASVPGTCHRADDADELTATASDTSPAVPCDQAHQTETLWTATITGPLGAQDRRANPELIKRHARSDL